MTSLPDSTNSEHERDVEAVTTTHTARLQYGKGIYLGMDNGNWSFTGPERSVMVLGPSRSGKTSSLVIPNLLLAEGPVVSTSTKPEVMMATAAHRSSSGWAYLYDPSGEIECPKGVERIGWSPITSAGHWDTAVDTANAMVSATHPTMGSLLHGGGNQHWPERAAALLAPLLHAAAQENLEMKTVVRWIQRHDGTTPLQILGNSVGEENAATDALAGIVSTDSREQSGIWSTASGVLAAYQSDSVIATTELPTLNTSEFCQGPNTMYICSPGRRQHLFAPLVVATLGDVRDATYECARQGSSTAPTLFALDEVANIAPLPDLEKLVSEGAGQGLIVMACLQDLSQARSRWGDAARGFLSIFGATVVMPGIADPETLRTLSALGGDMEVATTTISQSVGAHGRIRPSSSVSTVRVPRYPMDVIAHGDPGYARVLDHNRRFSDVQLTPAHASSPWRDMTTPERHHVRATSVALER
ncbi:MAG TPA: type IV secretory system conjugative DNA transfer family protein [Acidimicrobiales bacterium]